MIFGKLRALSDVFIGITIAIPERASVSFPIELQTDSRKWISRVSNSHWVQSLVLLL